MFGDQTVDTKKGILSNFLKNHVEKHMVSSHVLHFKLRVGLGQTRTQLFSLRGHSNTAPNVKYMKFTFVLIRIT